MRWNMDLVIIFKTKNYNNKIEMLENWLGFSDKDDREQAFKVIDEVAQGYRAMVINNTVHSNNISDIVSYNQVDIDHSVPKNFYFY